MTKISRRSLLRGAGAAAIALPFLESIGPRTFASAEPAAVPKRFVVFNRPWGSIPTTWTPSGSGSNFELNQIMEPLAGLKSKGKVSVVTGISMLTAENQFGGRGSHPQGELHSLTAHRSREISYRCIKWVNGESKEVPVNSHDQCDDGNFDIFGKAGGISIDSLIAENIWQGSRIKMLGVGRYDKGLSIDQNNREVPLINDLRTLFDTLFADSNTNVAELEEIRKRRASILDTVSEDFSRFRNRLSSRDRQRVESHFTSVREIEQSLQNASRICGAPVAQPEHQSFDGSSIFDRVRIANSLIVTALSCDITRVASLFWHPDGTTPQELSAIEPGVHADPHGEGSHAFPDQPDKIRNATALHKIWIKFLADLAEKMDAPEMVESNGKTVLDNSIVFHSSDMSTGLHTFKAGSGAWNNRSNGTYCRGMPYLYLGGGACGLKTNEHFVLDGANADQTNFAHGELLMTFARQMGISEQVLPTFGEPDLCQKVVAPIIA